jgi:PhzF family phenazine biosynthesis protein
MNQGTARFAKFRGAPAVLARAIGIDVSDFHVTLPIMYGSTGRWTLVVPVKSLEVMQRMRPFPDQFAAVLTEIPDASIHPFCLATVAPEATMHARHFSSPASGTLEDAVTGTASGVLGAYYRRFVADPHEASMPLLVEQGHEVGREGMVEVWVSRCGDDYAVEIAGSACFVGEISFDQP